MNYDFDYCFLSDALSIINLLLLITSLRNNSFIHFVNDVRSQSFAKTGYQGMMKWRLFLKLRQAYKILKVWIFRKADTIKIVSSKNLIFI